MSRPTWSDFVERPVPDVRTAGPGAELAEVLRRYRADLDAAARACADGRARALRALAEQAVLAVELEKLIDRDAALRPAHGALSELSRITRRMFEVVEAAGLEVVRLVGRPAEGLAGLAVVEHWRFDAGYPGAVVAEELEAAVRLDGAPLRAGRVVMGAPEGVAWRIPDPPPRPTPPSPARQRPAGDPAALRVVCPIEGCGTPNDPSAEVCAGCLTVLAGYIRVTAYPDVLFNRGIRAARHGDSHTARECFAAVALWLPDDRRARNAYALACLDAGDRAAARRTWDEVLERWPDDPVAPRGIRAATR